MCIVANIMLEIFQVDILWCNIEILRCNIESADVPDVHSGQYHAWVAFVPCIEFRPTQKVGSAWNQIKKSAEIKTK